jgi:WD40 repeat protein
LIFHAAAVLIYQNTKTTSQKLYTDHRDDILSIDYHKQSGAVITGEIGPKPLVNYYKNSKLVHSFTAPVTKGVLALAISPDGTKAVAAGMDDDHYIALLDLQSGAVITKQKGSKKVILKLGWVSDNEFVSVGIRHFKHWTYEGKNLSGKDGNSPAYFVSLAIGNDGTVLTGASQGTIYSWKGRSGKLAVTLKKPFIPINKDDEFN